MAGSLFVQDVVSVFQFSPGDICSSMSLFVIIIWNILLGAGHTTR